VPVDAVQPADEMINPADRSWYGDSVVWLVLAIAILTDQITKAIITSTLARGESWPDEGIFRATYVHNSGTAFGLFQDQGFILTIISFVAVGALIFFFRGGGIHSIIVRIAIGMMIGGAIGNLLDRVRLGFVVDFIDVGPWPIFNMADSFITVGIATLAVITILFPDKLSPASSPASNENASDSEHTEPADIPSSEDAG
jgi:signal peptidase II